MLLALVVGLGLVALAGCASKPAWKPNPNLTPYQRAGCDNPEVTARFGPCVDFNGNLLKP